MSDPRLRSVGWGVLLMGSGVLLLLFEFGLLAPYSPLVQYILAGAFVLAAIIFFGTFARTPADWWRVIPGWTLLGLAAVLVMSTLAVDQRWLGATVFFGLALAFTHVYLLDRGSRWWALIPGGFLLVLGLVIGVSAWIPSIGTLALLLFGGLGAVFFLLFLLHRRQWWAVIPGGVLIVFAALIAAPEGSDTSPLLRWWPLLLVLAGIVVAIRGGRRTRPERMEVNAARPAKRAQPQPGKASGAAPLPSARGALGEYTQPAPGATIEVLPDPDD
ncbi:MAG: hypothetical protein M9936_15955 [Caldilinea sp.]|nr:hypothetical protein [Caldilinea sp.]